MPGYPQILEYFMWEWQVYFRIACQTTAESLFNRLDSTLKPDILLIGFKIHEEIVGPPICIDPEEVPFSLNVFDNLPDMAKSIGEKDSDKNMLYSGEGVQEEMDLRFLRKSERLALEQILNNLPSKNDTIHFASSSVEVGNYYVFIVLGLEKAIYSAHQHLFYNDKEDRMKKHFSLLEAAKDAFLEEKTRDLRLPNPGKNLTERGRIADELLREAVRNFMYTIAFAGKEMEGIHMLFDACENISISRYEGKEAKGQLMIARKNHPDVETMLEIDGPFSIGDTRKTRKLLELSKKINGIICNSRDILGLGRIKGSYNPADESIFNIHFKGAHCWEVSHNGQVLFQMQYGVPGLEHEIFDKKYFYSIARRLFPSITGNQIKLLFKLACNQIAIKRGSMLVICDDARDEAKRLVNQCIAIKPVLVGPKLLDSLTAIDGAVIVDLDGLAYAKGVILDGLVGLNGDSARGSRYNSAVTYQEYRNPSKPTLIVVVSEDGMVDIIPKLMPLISHSSILKVIQLLHLINTREAFDRNAFYNAMRWLQNRAFYLTQGECDEINSIKEELQILDRHANDTTIWRVFENFSPNPRMNVSYYLKDK